MPLMKYSCQRSICKQFILLVLSFLLISKKDDKFLCSIGHDIDMYVKNPIKSCFLLKRQPKYNVL